MAPLKSRRADVEAQGVALAELFAFGRKPIEKPAHLRLSGVRERASHPLWLVDKCERRNEDRRAVKSIGCPFVQVHPPVPRSAAKLACGEEGLLRSERRPLEGI